MHFDSEQYRQTKPLKVVSIQYNYYEVDGAIIYSHNGRVDGFEWWPCIFLLCEAISLSDLKAKNVKIKWLSCFDRSKVATGTPRGSARSVCTKHLSYVARRVATRVAERERSTALPLYRSTLAGFPLHWYDFVPYYYLLVYTSKGLLLQLWQLAQTMYLLFSY